MGTGRFDGTGLRREVLPQSVVAAARAVLATGGSLNEAAGRCGVRACDLDYSLWAWIGHDLSGPAQHEPQF